VPARALFWLLAALWLILALPRLDTRYSYNWDSSQFERGVERFDIARHQPHPPGYPLWILALKGLTPLAGRANAAQVALALLCTIAALGFFRALAREALGEGAGLAATVLLAFSPLVCLHAIAPLTYAVDLFASCSLGWMAARLWRGRTRWAPLAFALAAVTAGFRQSGVTLLLPLLGAALWRSRRAHPVYAAGGVLAGAAFWLAWYVPAALLSGGFGALAALDRKQMMSSIRATSVFFGAPPAVHAHMVADVCLYFGLALAGLAPPLLTAWLGRLRPGLPQAPWDSSAGLFFALWLGPNLAVVSLLHCGQPGYILLSLPPLVLLGAWLAAPVLNRPRWMAAAAAVGLCAGYFPYERLIDPAAATVAYQLLRASPRLPGLLESSQRRIRALIDAMPGPPGEKLVFCLRQRTEAPNIRTVTYEYPDVNWADFEGPGLRLFPPHGGAVTRRIPATVRAVGWLCDGAGLPADLRARFPRAQRVDGNRLFSFYRAIARPSAREARPATP
jgi:hypothetical protein